MIKPDLTETHQLNSLQHLDFHCWDNAAPTWYMDYCADLLKSSCLLPSRMVQSSAGTQVDAWRWKCLKMLILVFVWLSRGALVRSGWYVTGLSIPGTKARETVDRVLLPVGFHTEQFREEMDFCSVSVLFHAADCAEPPSGYRDFQRQVFKKNMINWSDPLSHAIMGTLALFATAHFSENPMCRTETQANAGLRLTVKKCFFCFFISVSEQIRR